MNVKLYLALALTMTMGFACKSKQAIQEVAIPTGGQTEATEMVEETTTASTPIAIDPTQEVRVEEFEIEEGEAQNLLNYHVVVGSFQSKLNAQNLNNTLINEGNSSLIVVNEKGMFRVLIASCETYAQAQTRRNEIRSRFADAWILVQKQ